MERLDIGRVFGRPRRIQLGKRRCACGALIPRGRHDTCGWKCKAKKDRAAREIYRKFHRLREQEAQGEKAMTRLGGALKWLGIT